MASTQQNSNDTSSQVWFVTGSSRGLGRAIVEQALAAGHKVVGVARNARQLNDLASKYPSNLYLLDLDVTDAVATENVVSSAVSKFGRIDVVVNNAGIGEFLALEQTSIERFRNVLETNVFGVLNVIKAVLPYLKRQKSGHIFQISSGLGRVAYPGMSSYVTSKWALGGLSLVLEQELKHFGIKVVTLEPGTINHASGSMAFHHFPVHPDYEEVLGPIVKNLASSLGNENSSGEKIAKVIVDLVNKEDLPTRLLLGADAYGATFYAQKQLESDEKWKEVTLSVARQ